MLQFRKSVDHRGFESTLGYYKDVRLCVTRFLSGRPLLDTKFSQNIGLYRDGLPKRVGLVSCLIHQQDPNDLRVILTVLNYGRMFILSAKENPSIRSIVSPDCGYWTRTLDFQKFVRKWLKGKTRHYPSHCDSHRDPIYVGYGSGANGRPSLYASLWEARHIPSRYLTLFKQHSPNWEDDDLKITRDFVQKFTRLEKSDLFPYMFKIKTSKVKGKTKREQVPYDNEDNVFN